LAAEKIDLVGTTADFPRFGPRHSLPFNDLPGENSGTAGRIGEVGLRVLALAHQIDEGMALAIDGEIYQNAYLVPLNPESEIYLIPKNRRRLSGDGNF
jgi:hypothetical protein